VESELRTHADVALSRTISLSDAHWQRFGAKGLFGIDRLQANSRPSRRLVSLNPFATQLVRRVLSSCCGRCRTFWSTSLSFGFPVTSAPNACFGRFGTTPRGRPAGKHVYFAKSVCTFGPAQP
jgi:hypothetical protein